MYNQVFDANGAIKSGVFGGVPITRGQRLLLFGCPYQIVDLHRDKIALDGCNPTSLDAQTLRVLHEKRHIQWMAD